MTPSDRVVVDANHALAKAMDRAGGPIELRAVLEGYWTRALESLKARLDTEHISDDDASE